MPRPVGRPKSDVETEVIAVRIPVELGERLDRYLDHLETQTGIKSNRNSIVRHALRLFLDTQEQESMPRQRTQLPLSSMHSAAPPRKKAQGISPLRQQILTVVQQHPEGISPTETRKVLGIEKNLSDTMKGMERDGLLQRIAIGCYVVSREEE